MDWEALISRYCEAWGEPDAERRHRVLERIWGEDGTYTDPGIHLQGLEELVAHIGKVLAKHPGARIERIGLAQVHHGVARFAWRNVLPSGSTLRQGVDFAELSSDGKLRRIVGFFD